VRSAISKIRTPEKASLKDSKLRMRLPGCGTQELPWIIGVLALAFVLYVNALRNDFNFDDVTLVKENALIRSLSNLPKIFVSNYWANTPYEQGVLLYRPLAVATFALDYAVWGNNPFGFHLANALINAFNAALVLVLLMALLGDKLKPPLLALSALLFAFHPIHTEAVNMVVGRTELLAAFFGLWTFIFYLRGANRTAFVSFFLALLSKEIAVTVPLMLFLCDRLFGRKSRMRTYAVFGGVAAFYLAIRFAVLRGFVAAQQTGILDQQDVFQRAWTVAKVLGYYLKLFIVPYPLSPDYSDVALPVAAASVWVVVPAAIAAGLLACAWMLKHRAPALSFAVLWFFVTILPVSNIISIGAFLGERFLYLPSVSVAFLAAGFFGSARSRIWRTICVAGGACAVAIFAGLTFSRNQDWKDADTLWAKVLEQRPDNPRANYHMAARCDEQKDYERALPYYEKAIRHFPEHNWNPDRNTVLGVKQRLSAIYYILGLRLYKQSKFDEAMDFCNRSLQNNTTNAPACVVIGNIFAQRNDLKKATQWYETALKADPDQFEAKENLRRIQSLEPK
jgi:hypothetical protein